MTYYIPETKILNLNKLVARANKKGGNIVLKVSEDTTIRNGTLYINDPVTHTQHTQSIKVSCKEVFVDGCYKIDGWQFVGTIQFTDRGNIIRLADTSFEGKVPSKYNATPRICEHCGTVRHRKDTFLIYNSKTNEFKQVGSSCLLDYTRGLDADVCASIMSCLDQIANLSNTDFCLEDTLTYHNTCCSVDSSEVKKFAYALVSKYGYIKEGEINCESSARMLSEFMFHLCSNDEWENKFGDLKLPEDYAIKNIDTFTESINSEYGYMRNAKLAWLNTYCEFRDFSLICSFIATYLKIKSDTDKKVNSDSNVFVGNIGDRITLKVSNVRVLYCKGSYSYNGPVVTQLELTDECGHIYLWSTSSVVQPNMTVKATVKGHNVYRGVNQTVITRGSIL